MRAVYAGNGLFYYVPPAHSPRARGRERRCGLRRPLGTAATVCPLAGARELNRLDVLVLDLSDAGVGLRSPIGLSPGGVYRLRIGTAPHTAPHGADAPPVENVSFISLIRVTRSRRRRDGLFDVGAVHLETGTRWQSHGVAGQYDGATSDRFPIRRTTSLGAANA